MSNFIYNDNLNGNNGEDKEPIRFFFGGEQAKKSLRTSTFIIICVCCILASTALGIFGGFIIGDMTKDANEVVFTTIDRSPFEAIATNDSRSEYSRADIVEAVKDTVVEIRTQYVVSTSYFTQSGAGSGVIVGSYRMENPNSGDVMEKGYHVVTNAHVIENALNSTNSKITVTLTDGTEYVAYVIGSDSVSDIAVLKIITDKELTCATVANENYTMRVGDDIIVIGNPLGQLGGTVTNGFISALDREIEIDGIKMNLLQVDAPVNPGNSGGGLFNLRGELVGIVNAKSVGTDIEGIGFAIPVNDALKIYREYTTLGYITGRPTIFAEYDIKYGNSLYVSKVLERDTGDNSRLLKQNDQIYGVVVGDRNVAITSAAELDSVIAKTPIGGEITLLVRRGYQSLRLTVRVFEYYE